MSNEAKIISIKLDEVSMTFKPNESEKFKLQVTTESHIMPPKSEEDKTALLNIKASIFSLENDNINVNASANIIFEFNEIPTDYNKACKELCLKKAQVQIFDKIGDIMETMGYHRFDIEIPD